MLTCWQVGYLAAQRLIDRGEIAGMFDNQLSAFMFGGCQDKPFEFISGAAEALSMQKKTPEDLHQRGSGE